MKKKISMVLAGLGLCASMIMFSAQEAKAVKDPCIAESKHGETGTWTQGSCYGSSGGCEANVCK